MVTPVDTSKKILNLSLGYPDLKAIPKEILIELAGDIMSANRGLQYGGDMMGPLFARKQIAAFLSTMLSLPVEPSELALSSGSVHGIDVICRTLTNPGDVVLVEDPTFFFVFTLFKMSPVEVVGVPLCEGGPDLNELERLAKHYGKRLKLFYTIPSFHNPTGITTPLHSRHKLLEFSKQYQFTILEDTAYQFLYFDDAPPPMLRQLDPDSGGVVTVGTFSKLLAPSLRQGWMWAKPEQIQQFASYKSDAGASTLTSELVSEFLRRGDMDRHLPALRQFYASRRTRMVETIRAKVPEWVSWTAPGGGYFLWMTLPEDAKFTASELRRTCLERGMDFMPGQICFTPQYQAKDRYIRLCFAYPDEDTIEAGINILGTCLREMA